MVDSVIQIGEPFKLFHDIDGQPLEDGYIYIGEYGLDPITNPVTVYSDSGLMISLAQPIRTLGGYPYASGTPTKIFAPIGNYSITVLNKRGTLIYTDLTVQYNDNFSVLSFDSIQSAADSDLSGVNNIQTISFYPGWESTLEGPEGGASYAKDGTIGAASTLYTDNSGFYDVNGIGYRIEGTEFYIEQFGGIGDGVTDNSLFFQYALEFDRLSILRLKAKSYAISETLDLISGKHVIGEGGGGQYPPAAFINSPNFIGLAKTSIIALAGSGLSVAGSMMVRARPDNNALYADQTILLQGVLIDCDDIATRGIDWVSVKNSRIHDVLIMRPISLAMLVTVLPVVDATIEGNNATQFNEFDQITAWVQGTAVGIRCTGTTLHNTNNNNWRNIKVVHVDGDGIELLNTDADNWFGVNTISLGTGYGCTAYGAATADEACRNITMYGTEFAGPSTAQGGFRTITGASPVNYVQLFGYSTGNGTPLPEIANGDRVHYYPDLYFYTSDPVEARSYLDKTKDWGTGESLAGHYFRTKLTGSATMTEVGRIRMLQQGGAGTEAARFDFFTYQAAALALRMYLANGLVVGAPTGGDKGLGTINAQAVYDDNVLLTDYVFDAQMDGIINPEDGNKAQNFDMEMLSPEKFAEFWKLNRRLPSMPSREEWKAGKLSIGDLLQRIWETVEVQAIHINKLTEKMESKA